MTEDESFKYLKQVPIFSSLSRRDLDRVAQIASVIFADAGQVLMREGDMAHEMLVVIDGALEITRGGVRIADIGTGGFAGEMALLTHSQRTATVTAVVPSTLLSIDGRSFSTLLEEAPQIAVAMLPIVAQRVTENSLASD